jgi:hypothetical protein
MLLYLTTNTRMDIAFAVSQAARFCNTPKRSHASAVKTIVRYLAGTADKGMIIRPTRKLDLVCWVDADFLGLAHREPDDSPMSARSRTGFIITLSGVPLIWRSFLQSAISTSTAMAEYQALSSAMTQFLPI